MTDMPQVVCVVSPRTHTDTVRSVHWSLHTRVYIPRMPMTWSLVAPRPAQGKSTVEVGRVYLIADKGLDLAPSYPESRSRSLRWNPPEPRGSSTLYGHGLGFPWQGRDIGMIFFNIHDAGGVEKRTEASKPTSSLSSRLRRGLRSVR